MRLDTADLKRVPAFIWAVLISAAVMSPVLWKPAEATQHPVKDQARIVPELSLVPVLYVRNDPWIVKEVPTISYRGDHYAKKPTQEADRSEIKRLQELKKKRSDLPEDVIRNASRSALLSYAKASIGKRGPQLGLPSSLWCADAVNAWLRKVGLPGTGSRMARSFVAHPKFEKIKSPKPGDIVVIARGRSNVYGHVALYNGSCGKGAIKLLGGNQAGGRVTNQCVSGARVVGYVRPKTIPETVVARLMT